MTDLYKAAEQALEALDLIFASVLPYDQAGEPTIPDNAKAAANTAITALREALAAPDDSDANAPWLTEAHALCFDAGIMPGHISDRLVMLRAKYEAALAKPVVQGDSLKFSLGDRVTKTSGSKWTGLVVGFYSTALTPVGYAVESETETGSVQIYPEKALAAAPQPKDTP